MHLEKNKTLKVFDVCSQIYAFIESASKYLKCTTNVSSWRQREAAWSCYAEDYHYLFYAGTYFCNSTILH